MAKPGRHRRGGRATPKGTRPRSLGTGPGRDRGADEPDLLAEVRRRLASGEPLDLLAEVSTLLAALDPRADDPLERAQGGKRNGQTVDQLTRSFAEVDRVETSALLAGIAHLAADDLVRAHARRALADRHHGLPTWLARLGEMTSYRAVEMVHVLGDGDNVIVGVRLPGGHELTLVVYIDHNLGSVVKDAFVVPEPVAQLVEWMRSKNDDSDVAWLDLTLADARVRIAEAIDIGAMTFPPFETDTWPACRPLVEWVNRLLPEGGEGSVRPEWDDAARAELTDRFFASDHGSSLDDNEGRQQLESVLWFATDYGPGDPQRWSPTAVEILLLDWLPRKIVADAGFLSRIPELLRAYVRFCHGERQIRAELTEQTLEAIDQFEPEYQRTIRTPRPQGPAALLATMGVLDPDGPWELDVFGDEEEYDYQTMALGWLCDAVGGEKALETLDDVSLSDEPFSWTNIAQDVHDRVREVLVLCDRFCDERLDVEYRTACRRLLAQVANGDPNVFRRKARSDTAAAALCWIVGKANELFSPYVGAMMVKDLTDHFGLAQGGVSQRAETLLKAAGVDRSGRYGEIDLGSPDLLVSSRRRRIVERRDRLLA